MRLCLFVVFVSCLGHVCCNTQIIDWSGIERLYSKLFERMIRVLEDQVEKIDMSLPEDEDRISCINGLNALIKNMESSWAHAMIDSSSKLQSGILAWNLMDLGEYDQCIKVSVVPTEEKPQLPAFNGRYCLITNKIYIQNGTVEVFGEKLGLKDMTGNPNYLPLKSAQCYPSLCKPHIIQEALNGVLDLPDNDFSWLGLGFNGNVTVYPKDCHVAERTPYDALDWIVLIIILLLVLLGLISAVTEYFYVRLKKTPPSSGTMKLLGSFSFYTNTKKLFSTGMVQDAIPSLNGLKFISICWIILGHRYTYMSREPVRNFAEVHFMWEGLLHIFIANGILAVDTFFLISGMLNMYGFLTVTKSSKQYKIKDVLKGYIHRYLRLTPAYLMMVGFTATWMYHLRDGPLWDKFAGPPRENCRVNYWANLIYLNNYLNPQRICMMQSWYLSVDMQLFIFSPLIMYPLWKWPKYGWTQWVVFTLASIISPFLTSWYGHIQSPVPISADEYRKGFQYIFFYIPTHTRFTSYMVGIGAGYILFQYRNGRWSLDLNFCTRTMGWLLSVALMLYAVFGGYSTFQVDYQYDQLFSSYFNGFHRLFWSVGLLWMILMCVRGYGGFINSFLSWKLFTSLGRLSYSIYLTHVVILICRVAARRNSYNYTDYEEAEFYLGDVILSVLSGLVLTLLVEAPMLNIEKLVFRGGQKKERRSSTSTPTEQGNHIFDHTLTLSDIKNRKNSFR